MSANKLREFSDLSSLVVDDIFVGHRGFRLPQLTHTLPKMKDSEIAYALIGYLAADGITPDIVIDSASDYFPGRDERIAGFIDTLFATIRKSASIDHPTDGKYYVVSDVITNKVISYHKNSQSRQSKVKQFSNVEGMVVDGVFVGNSGFEIKYLQKQDAQTAAIILVGSLHFQPWDDVIYNAESLLSFDTFEKAKWIIQDMMLDIARHGFLDMSFAVRSSGKLGMIPVSESIKANVEKWFDDQPASKFPVIAKICGSFSAIERLVVRDQFVGCTAISNLDILALNSIEEMAFAATGQLAVKSASEVVSLCKSLPEEVRNLVEKNIRDIAISESIKVPWANSRVIANEGIVRNCKEWRYNVSDIGEKPSEMEMKKYVNPNVFSTIEKTVKDNVFFGHCGVSQSMLAKLPTPGDKAIAFVGALTHCSVDQLIPYINDWDYSANKVEVRDIFLSKCAEIATTGKVTFGDGKQYYANNQIAKSANFWYASLSGDVKAKFGKSSSNTKNSDDDISSGTKKSDSDDQRFAVSLVVSNNAGRYVQVIRAKSPGHAMLFAGVKPDFTDVVYNAEEEFVEADNSREIDVDYDRVVHPCRDSPALIMQIPPNMSAEDAINHISAGNSLIVDSKQGILRLFNKYHVQIDSESKREEKEGSQMAIEKPANKPISAKSMIVQDAEDAALRATGKAASRFSRKILVDSLIPKIENPIVQSAVKKFVDSSWGLSVINISFGYFYPLIESRIPMSEDVKAFGSVVAQHMRRDGLSDVIVDLAAEIAGPIKDFLTEQMNMIPKAQLEKILESQKVRAVDDAITESPSAIDVATASALNGKQSKKHG